MNYKSRIEAYITKLISEGAPEYQSGQPSKAPQDEVELYLWWIATHGVTYGQAQIMPAVVTENGTLNAEGRVLFDRVICNVDTGGIETTDETLVRSNVGTGSDTKDTLTGTWRGDTSDNILNIIDNTDTRMLTDEDYGRIVEYRTPINDVWNAAVAEFNPEDGD